MGNSLEFIFTKILANKRNKQRAVFAAIGIGFLIVLIGFVGVRVASRKSIVSVTDSIDSVEREAVMQMLTSVGSGVHVQDFHRVQVKKGATVWEVRAKEARYSKTESVAQVTDVGISIFRPREPTVKIRSRGAKMYIDKEEVQRAELEGAIVVEVGDGLEIRTERASYDASKRLITSSELVTFSGTGYSVKGVGLELPIDSDMISLLSDTETRVEKSAALPKKFAVGGRNE